MDDTRPFPIQGKFHGVKPSTIPWWLAELAYKEYVSKWGAGLSKVEGL